MMQRSQRSTCHKSAALQAMCTATCFVSCFCSTWSLFPPLACSTGGLALLLQHLVSLSTIGIHSELSDDQLASQAKQQMAEWFGAQLVDDWQLLRVYRIPYAQPPQVRLQEMQQATAGPLGSV